MSRETKHTHFAVPLSTEICQTRLSTPIYGAGQFCANQPRSKFLGRSHTTVLSFSRLVASSKRFMEVEENRRRESLTELRLI
jgi:hypothetical protein